MNHWYFDIFMVVRYRGVGNGPAGPVLARPLLQGKNIISFLQKASDKQKC